ncbi:hypothetical protein BG261_03740 [Floricoccus tropicus]|uniref:ABC-2 type transporter transmembrane domain-containing protein n=1 Tax=Floricoccus tropicus TaxID=1859473 RepID=A0A1E8GNI9_9LACT|nr:ABC transporter permease [Floricoccus tropicus]OFI49193.1 hypothetical protein BG261_03740 [Floricoccus tropicus]
MNNQTALVAKQVYKSRIKSIGFWGIVLSPIIVALVGIGITFLMGSMADKSQAKLAIVNDPQLVKYIKASKSLDVEISEVSSVDTAKNELSKEKIDGYLNQDNGKFTLIISSEANAKIDENTIRNLLTQYQFTERASKLNLSNQEIASLQAPADLSVHSQDKKGDTKAGGDVANGANYAISSATGILIFMLLSIYVGMIAQEIANEKSSRIMEILLAATSAKVQYYGKLIGIFALALTQIAIYVATVFIALFFFKDNDMLKMVKEVLSGVDLGFLAVTLAMVLVAIFGYLVLASIVASLVNEQSQVQQAVAPVMYLSMIGYILGFTVAGSPNNLLIKILSYVPYISQSLMPSRLAIQYATMKEAVIALVIEVVVIGLITKGAEKVYAKNVLSYSDDKIFKQLINSFKRS